MTDTTQTYVAGTWYRFRIVAQAAANRFDLYVNDVFVRRSAFRNTVPVLGKISFGGTATSTGATEMSTCHVDALRLCQ